MGLQLGTAKSNRNHILAAGVGVAMTMAAFGGEASMMTKVDSGTAGVLLGGL